MNLRYHFTLSFAEGGSAPSREEIYTVLKKHGLVTTEGALGELPLGHGALRAEQTDPGLQLSFPLGLPDPEGERAIDTAFLLAGELEANLFDLQVATLVHPADRRRVVECWKNNYRIQVSLVGPESLGPGMPSQPRQAPFLGWMKLVAVVLGLIVLALAVQYAACEACVIEPFSKYWH